MAFFNRSETEQTIDVKRKFLSFMPKGTFTLMDIWGTQSVAKYKKGEKLSLKIKAHGVVFMKYSQIEP